MSEPDMDAAVTRREMHDALGHWSGAIITQVTERVTAVIDAKLVVMHAEMRAMEARLLGELRRHTNASAEELTARMNVIDEQYKDLPARVTRLEAKVFAPAKRRATARRRKRS